MTNEATMLASIKAKPNPMSVKKFIFPFLIFGFPY
jgi:hypothetical protein